MCFSFLLFVLGKSSFVEFNCVMNGIFAVENMYLLAIITLMRNLFAIITLMRNLRNDRNGTSFICLDVKLVLLKKVQALLEFCFLLLLSRVSWQCCVVLLFA